jgi:hypothetical protein
MSPTDSQQVDKKPGVWRPPFVTFNGSLSVARVHIGLGTYYLIYPLVSLFWSAFVRRGTADGANAEGAPVWTLLVALIILIVGGIALVLEARVERMPNLALWSAPLERQASNTPATPYWCDIAVLQLAIGVLLVPALALAAPTAVTGWRIVAITTASELVYLAFLSARLIQKEELSEVLHAIEEIKALATTSTDKEWPKTEEERLAQQKIQQKKLHALEARVVVLMEQVGLAFAAPNAAK